jgi:tetratricopeptide (TPR) repeat protein
MNKNKKTLKEILDAAIELNDNNSFQEAIAILEELSDRHLVGVDSKNSHIIYGHLGINYMDIGNNEKALEYFEQSLELKPEYEFSSLGKYIALHNLNKDDRAIAEMFRFLKKNRANLYIGTIEELLEGLKDGFMSTYEQEIRRLAKDYNLATPPGDGAD